jgi:hypothetical protein
VIWHLAELGAVTLTEDAEDVHDAAANAKAGAQNNQGKGRGTPPREAIPLPRRSDSDHTSRRQENASGGRRQCYDSTTMSNRLLRLVGPGLLVAAVAAWSGALSAQAPLKGSIARTPDGHPDLQGTFDVATLTPLQRPANVPKLVLTPQEASALEQYEAQRNAKNAGPVSGDRPAPPVGGDTSTPKSFLEFLERAGGGAVGGYNNFWLASGTKVISVNGEKRSSIIVDPPDGKIPAMKAEARTRNQALLASVVNPSASEGSASGPASAFDNPEQRPLAERCLLGFGSTSGPPTLPNYFYNNLKQIVQTRDTILILNEMVHDARIIRMNAQHPPSSVRKWMGDSIGRWDGDTLVVDTTNFTNKTRYEGSDDALHVVERFTRVDANTILYRFTVEDPTTWDRPWTGEYPWVASSEQIFEYACHEGNHALENILRGARVQERGRSTGGRR